MFVGGPDDGRTGHFGELRPEIEVLGMPRRTADNRTIRRVDFYKLEIGGPRPVYLFLRSEIEELPPGPGAS